MPEHAQARGFRVRARHKPEWLRDKVAPDLRFPGPRATSHAAGAVCWLRTGDVRPQTARPSLQSRRRVRHRELGAAQRTAALAVPTSRKE